MKRPGQPSPERQWIHDCIFHYTGPDEASQLRGTSKFRLEIGDIVLDGDGDAFLGQVAFKRGDPIDHEFGGYRALREAGSSEIRLIDPLGVESRLKFKGFVFCGILWTSRWFRLLPRGEAVVHETPPEVRR